MEKDEYDELVPRRCCETGKTEGKRLISQGAATEVADETHSGPS